MIGTILMERYRLDEQIGEGGMASVFRAMDLRTGHRVAVKFLKQELQNNPEFLDRFRREATAASRMSHHNIVNLLDIGDDPSRPYLVFEFVDGKTLKEIIAEHGHLPEGTAVQIAIRILSALRHAHEAGVVHRDIKPQNILVDRQGYIKVADFGIARMVGANTSDLEKKQGVMGSVHYFSPEQAKGETATFSSDLYSVGCVLYEMLTGKMPFEGETQVSIAMQHVQAEAKPIRELVKDVSSSVEAVVMKAMAKEPADRYPSALLMAQALHSALSSTSTNDEPVFVNDKKQKLRQKARQKALSKARILMILLGMVLMLGIFTGAYFIYVDIVNTTKTPLLTGYLVDQAVLEAQKEGIRTKIIRNPSADDPVDVVIDQSVDFGSPIKRGDVLLLIVSSGPINKPVPKVTGLSLENARKQLERVSLEVLVVSVKMDPMPRNTVLSQEPQENIMADAGSIIQLVVSAGQVEVPDLSGMIWTEASDVLKKSKLLLGKVEYIEIADPAQQGRVASQLPLAKELSAEEAAVDIVVYVASSPQEKPEPNGGNPS
ncbi:MAG: protein kinase [Bacillota bacterium]|nr:protein kinase [Bacillota bacterium]